MVPDYLHLVISHYRYSGLLAEVARGVGIQHLGVGRFSELRIPVPPKAEQREIVEQAERQLAVCRTQGDAARNSLRRVELMKQEVIAAAVSGELVAQRDGEETGNGHVGAVGTAAEGFAGQAETQGTKKDGEGVDRGEITGEHDFTVGGRIAEGESTGGLRRNCSY